MSEELNHKLKTARKKLDLSQSRASTAWGIPLRTLIGWENDQRTPRGFALRQLNALLDEVIGVESPSTTASSSPPRPKRR